MALMPFCASNVIYPAKPALRHHIRNCRRSPTTADTTANQIGTPILGYAMVAGETPSLNYAIK